MLYLMLVGFASRPEVEKKPAASPVSTKHPLRDALFALGITPLNKATVAKEKDAMLQSMYSAWHLRHLGSPIGRMVSLVMATVATSVFVFAISAGEASVLMACLFLCACLVCGASFWSAYLVEKYFPLGAPQFTDFIGWRRATLKEWDLRRKPMPEVVRAKIAVLQQALPLAAFSVDWVDADPYVVIELDGEEEFIHQF